MNNIDVYEFNLTIDYTKTVEQAIADGKYDSKNNDITVKNFPTPPEMVGKTVDISGKLFHFNRDFSSQSVIKKMNKKGFRPATLIELLALGAVHPELQKQFSIIALGSVWHDFGGSRQVPYLLVHGVGRRLSLSDFDGAWFAWFHFLGVRK